MRIEYREKSSNGPFIRLFHFSNKEVLEFKNLLKALADGKCSVIEMQNHKEVLDYDETFNLCFYVGTENQGIIRTEDGFKCVLNKTAYSNMIELVSSFGLHALEAKGFEWLDETSGISLLISPDDKWSTEPQEAAAGNKRS